MGHHGATINALAWSPDGDYIASGDANGTILIWDSFTGATVQTFREPAAKNVSSLAWSPENTSSVLAGYPNMLVIWDARSGKPTFTTTSLTGPADYSPLGTYKQCYLRYPLLLAACQNQASVLVFPAASLNTPIASIDAGSIHTLAFSPFQEQLGLAFVTATPPQKLVVYGAYINTTCAQDGPANATISYKKFDMPDPGKAGVAELSIPWGQGSSYLLAGSLPGTVMIQGTWGTYEMDHPAEVVAAAICPGEHPLPANANPDGWSTVIGYIATADSTGVVRIWGNDQKYLVAMQSRQPVLQLAWSPDGSALAVVSADGTVQVWQANLSSLDALWRNTSFN